MYLYYLCMYVYYVYALNNEIKCMIFGNEYNKVSRFRFFEQVSSQCDRFGCLFE